MQWLDSIAGAGYAQAIVWTLLALIALVVVLGLVKLVRSFNSGTYVAGGRNRKTRLAVMDATAIDNHRRLVLVRRDDVEHLILIGGPTDVVVEQDIRLHSQPRRALTGEQPNDPPAPPQQRRASDAQPLRTAQLPSRDSRPSERLASQPAPAQRAVQEGRPEPRPARAAPPPPPSNPPLPPADSPAAPARGNSGQPAARPSAPSASERDQAIDDQLMKELEVSLDGNGTGRPHKSAAASLDDEMTRLLGELSSKR